MLPATLLLANFHNHRSYINYRQPQKKVSCFLKKISRAEFRFVGRDKSTLRFLKSVVIDRIVRFILIDRFF